MCREDGEGLKAPLTCLRFVPRGEEGAASTLVVPRQDAQDYCTEETSSCHTRRIYFAS